MKAFLEEYGLALFVIACVTVMIAMAQPVGNAIQKAVVSTVTEFTSETLNL